jgi:flagellar protein FlaF
MKTTSYQSTNNNNETLRGHDYRRLAEMTALLIRADDKKVHPRLWINAIKQNQQWWSQMRMDVLNARTSMTQEIRASFIDLAGWVEKESVLVATQSTSLQSLIAVNKQIMNGLRPFEGAIHDDSLTAK